jgi:hypothetical protein
MDVSFGLVDSNNSLRDHYIDRMLAHNRFTASAIEQILRQEGNFDSRISIKDNLRRCGAKSTVQGLLKSMRNLKMLEQQNSKVLVVGPITKHARLVQGWRLVVRPLGVSALIKPFYTVPIQINA